jgi:hypothetical protein
LRRNIDGFETVTPTRCHDQSATISHEITQYDNKIFISRDFERRQNPGAHPTLIGKRSKSFVVDDSRGYSHYQRASNRYPLRLHVDDLGEFLDGVLHFSNSATTRAGIH